MLSFPTVLMNVYKAILENAKIGKLLYYPSEKFSDDPLSEPTVAKTTIQNYIKKVSSDYLIDIIRGVDTSNDKSIKRGYMTVFSEDQDRMDNPYARNQGVRIEIYMPVRKFEEYQYRIDTITDILFELFVQKNITGSFGKLIMDRVFRINPNIDGYDGIAVIFNAGGMNV